MKIPNNPNETEEMQRAAHAESLLNDPLIEAALDAIEAHHHKHMLMTELDDREGRELSFQMLRTAKTFRRLLHEHVTTGTLASTQKDSRDVQESVAAQ